jgi:hypothetical protein
MHLNTHQGGVRLLAPTSTPPAAAAQGRFRRATRDSRATRAVTIAVAALSLAGCFGGGDPQPGPPGASSPGQAATTSAARATFSLSVGLQPTHLTEKMDLKLDGQPLADWSTDADNPSRIVTLSDVPTGEQRYELAGTYTTYNAKGFLEEKPVQGSGTVTVADGGFYGIYYDAAKDVFELQRLR